MARMSRLLSFIAGAASVGVVIGVLALAGAFGGDSTTIVRSESDTPPTSTTAPAKATAVADIYARVSSGVVFVQANSGRGQLAFPGGGRAASGSGFVIDDDGHVVTNDHVVEGATQYRVRFGAHGKPIVAKLLGTDPSADLALLKVDPKAADLHPLALGASNQLRPGDLAVAIGSPFGLQGTVTSGIVSALGRTITAPNGFSISGAVQTDAAINPGNSGGPLLDAQGRVIGVNSQIQTNGGSDQNSGVGFAVPVDAIKRALPALEQGKSVQHAYLGVSTQAAANGGADVNDVIGGGPADKAGLRKGDTIVTIGGADVREPDDVAAAVNARKPGDEVAVVVERGGDRRTLTVTLGAQPRKVSTP
jgi:S1-C subfamily serine protease